jgi:hypothetical protein
MEVNMVCCKDPWKMWLYILAIIVLIIGLFQSGAAMWSMIVLAILLAIASGLIKGSSHHKEEEVAAPKAKKRRR